MIATLRVDKCYTVFPFTGKNHRVPANLIVFGTVYRQKISTEIEINSLENGKLSHCSSRLSLVSCFHKLHRAVNTACELFFSVLEALSIGALEKGHSKLSPLNSLANL